MIVMSFAQKERIGFQYVLDALHTNSPYGAERVRNLKPFRREERAELLRQLTNVQLVMQGEPKCQKALAQLLRVFMTVKDIRSTVEKCRETALNEIELFEVKCFLLRCSEMLPLFRELQPVLQLEGVSLKDTDGALQILDPEGNRVASFYLTDGSSPLLRALRKEKRGLEEQIRRATGEERASLQAERTLVAADEEREERRIRKELSEALRPYIPDMLHNMEMIGEIDLTVEKARLARRYGGVMPELTEDILDMRDMVNPKVSDLLQDQKKTFTPISIALEKGAAVITGANMGGKSVAIKTIALNVLLTHCGFFPFAGKALVPMFDSLYMISEDLESVDRGLSSFGGEMVAFNRMVGEMEGQFPLILLDEFARGTNPEEGSAIVQAVIKYLNRRNAVSVLATHYDRVAQWAGVHYQVIGLKELDLESLKKELESRSDEGGVKFIAGHMNYGLYRVEGGQDCPRDAVNICRLLDMKDEILQEIDEILTDR